MSEIYIHILEEIYNNDKNINDNSKYLGKRFLTQEAARKLHNEIRVEQKANSDCCLPPALPASIDTPPARRTRSA